MDAEWDYVYVGGGWRLDDGNEMEIPLVSIIGWCVPNVTRNSNPLTYLPVPIDISIFVLLDRVEK